MQFVELTSDQLHAMSDAQLDDFLWNGLGISAKPSWDRYRKISFIVGKAATAGDLP